MFVIGGLCDMSGGTITHDSNDDGDSVRVRLSRGQWFCPWCGDYRTYDTEQEGIETFAEHVRTRHRPDQPKESD